jgi:hypothetical protein
MTAHGSSGDSFENEEDRYSRAEEYCDGYSDGFLASHKSSTIEEDLATKGSESYCCGFKRGFVAGRPEDGAPKEDREKNLHEVGDLESDYLWQREQFTPEQWEKWKLAQGRIKAQGNRSWQDALLELYRQLRIYGSGVIVEREEKEALHIVRFGVVKRLAKTSL